MDSFLKEKKFSDSIEGTSFTAMTINVNFGTCFHLDTDDFPVMAPMVTFRAGSQRGGNLLLPSIGYALKCDNLSCSIFPASKLYHGVSPLNLEEKDAYRITCIAYLKAKHLVNFQKNRLFE
jgi:hypothetical protein